VLPAMPAVRVFQHLVNSFLGVALNRLNRYVYDVAYGLISSVADGNQCATFVADVRALCLQ
jgi:hypothetical protein